LVERRDGEMAKKTLAISPFAFSPSMSKRPSSGHLILHILQLLFQIQDLAQ
jgi:hypothetical protein